jgi:hypothetical protein
MRRASDEFVVLVDPVGVVVKLLRLEVGKEVVVIEDVVE